jgi:hypothetical protein
MIVTTHFESLDGGPISEKNKKMLELWKKGWELRGFQCIITDEKIYKDLGDDTLFLRFKNKVESFPSVNTPGFDRSSFMRWFAAYIVSRDAGTPICVTESDVMNYSLTPSDLAGLSEDKFNIADRDYCPAFVYTSAATLKHLVSKISDYELQDSDSHDGRKHISDQNYIAMRFVSDPCYNSVMDLIGSVLFTEDWIHKKMVHYGTPFFMMKNMDTINVSKAEYIHRLRPL